MLDSVEFENDNQLSIIIFPLTVTCSISKSDFDSDNCRNNVIL
jgi:hypothetical protein